MEANIPHGSHYPADLAGLLYNRWVAEGMDASDLPSSSTLESLVDIAYQASLLREEGAPVMVRMVYVSPQDSDLQSSHRQDGLHVIAFDRPQACTPHQIRKIAAAANYYRSLIGVCGGSQSDGSISLWGMLVTGTDWIHQTEGALREEPSHTLPTRLVVHVLGPGNLLFTAGNARVLETIGGQVLTEGFDPFHSKWLPKHFESVRSQLLGQMDLSMIGDASVRLCDSFVRDVAQNLVRRVLRLVRTGGHGGMLIYLSDEQDERLSTWLRLRMRFHQDHSTHRFQNLMRPLMQRALEVGAQHGIAEVRWNDFQRMRDLSLNVLHDSLIEFSHFLADLMSVDGSLVLNRDFRVIGFGGEILGDSHVDTVERALDLEAEASISEPADASGTRHRSAYRLVSSVPDAIAVVVSQDGAVRFVAHRGGRVVYWPYLP